MPGGSREQRELLKRTFGDLPIEDAEVSTTILVSKAAVHAAEGNSKDPENCVLAHACRLQLGSQKVAFFSTIAYVEMPDERGVRKVLRYTLGHRARELVKFFDDLGVSDAGVTVTLHAPAPSNRLDARYEARKRHAARKREAVLRGEIKSPKDRFPGTAPRKSPAVVGGFDVRDGSGMVQHLRGLNDG